MDTKAARGTLTLKDFAFKKQAPMDGLGNAVINLITTYLLLTGVTSVPVISPPGSKFAQSLLGTLAPPAIVIAFAISLLTTKIAIKKRIKGEVLPPLGPGTPWVKRAVKWGLARAVLNVLVVYGVGGIMIQFSPRMEISRVAAALIVGVVAGAIAYIESVAAVLRTNDLTGHTHVVAEELT